ncbi:MAG: patatin-like phospholipase family protein [candidate division Zixibacteria bacterium]|nr:patatin-like phospholipase family protein [candidate division Zixibacteria bacterium]
MPNHFKNLIFEGGGVKGIAYVGAIEELQAKNIIQQIERVGGASAGAINAILVGLNYSVEETKEVLWKLNFNNLMDDSWGFIKDTTRLIDKYGWYKGDFFREWIGNVIKTKTGNSESTFSDIHARKASRNFKDMYFIGTNLSTHFCEVFSYEHTPRVCIADAVRISMSIPLFFAAKRSLRGDLYVDGGVLLNYPIKLFDREKYISEKGRNTEYYDKHNKNLADAGINISKYVFNKETLGFRLDSAKEIAVFRDHSEPEHNKIDDFFSYAWSLISSIMENQQNTHLHNDDWQRTVYIDTLGVKTTEFDLQDEMKEKLVESGCSGVKKYFEWYDNNSTANK